MTLTSLSSREMIKATLIINGIGKKSSKTLSIIGELKKIKELDLTVLSTKAPKHAILLAKEASHSTEVIIAAGGDGTVNEVLNGIMQGDRNTILGVLPAGTGNDFHRSIGTFNPQEFINAILHKKLKKVDVGVLRASATEDYFLNIADFGFGEQVVDTLNRQRKRGIGGKFSYAMAILRTFLTYRKEKVRIETEDFSFKGKVLMITFCNGKTFGHGLTISPDAEIDSKNLELTIIGYVSIITYLRNLKNLKKGIKINHPEVQYTSAKSFKIKTLNEFIRFEADGELYRNDYTEVSVLPHAIQLLSPDV